MISIRFPVPCLSGLAMVLLLLAGCASNQPVTGAGGIRTITEAEIRESDADDVLELIQQLRPAWIMTRTVRDPSDPSERGGPVVLINDIPPRPLYTLQFMSLANIREIRNLTKNYAETRFRVGAPEGAILILTSTGVGSGDTIQPDTGGTGRPGFSPAHLSTNTPFPDSDTSATHMSPLWWLES
jgi:hypothetical protein